LLLTWCIFVSTVTIYVFLCIQLEKALKEVQADESEVRQAADKQLAQARELVASIEERSVQADLKLAQVQVVRADANRKLQESERCLQEVEAREVALRRERHSLMAEYVSSNLPT
jgi:septal ring factor EnvC (AmiA/AmiB activator)